mmetsp:Transcript_2697/g.7430  ORF Transcript_2697/g.7430 Transcript_2697/m.7430 type:complete len:265 (+) Transcript_2697:155-949(+)
MLARPGCWSGERHGQCRRPATGARDQLRYHADAHDRGERVHGAHAEAPADQAQVVVVQIRATHAYAPGCAVRHGRPDAPRPERLERVAVVRQQHGLPAHQPDLDGRLLLVLHAVQVQRALLRARHLGQPARGHLPRGQGLWRGRRLQLQPVRAARAGEHRAPVVHRLPVHNFLHLHRFHAAGRWHALQRQHHQEAQGDPRTVARAARGAPQRRVGRAVRRTITWPVLRQYLLAASVHEASSRDATVRWRVTCECSGGGVFGQPK